MAESFPKIRIVRKHSRFVARWLIDCADEGGRTRSVCCYIPDPRRVAHYGQCAPVDVDEEVGQTSFCFYPWPIILRGCFFLNVARRLNFVDTGKHCSPLLTLFILLLWHCVQFVLFLSFVVAAFNLCHFLIVTLFLSVPHPSENHIQIRIQMYGGLSLPPSSSSLEI